MNGQGNLPPWVNPLIPEDDELARSLANYDQELDSYQAGAMGPDRGPMGPMPPPQQMGPPAPGPMPPVPQMPRAYTENRMQQWGMPKVAQWGEGIVDKIRANRWEKQQAINPNNPMSALEQSLADQGSNHPTANKPVPVEVDEVQMLNAGGDPSMAYNNAQGPGGTGPASLGQKAGNIFGKIASYYTGGMI